MTGLHPVQAACSAIEIQSALWNNKVLNNHLVLLLIHGITKAKRAKANTPIYS